MADETIGGFVRSSGVLLHPTALPGPWGSGSIGAHARAFVDLLAEAGQRHWQVLPLNALGGSTAPYSANSTFAGNTLLIDLDELVGHGLLDAADLAPLADLPDAEVDFARMVPLREAVLAKAGAMLAQDTGHPLHRPMQTWRRRHAKAWLEDYALFEALSRAHGRQLWTHWPQPLKDRKPSALKAAKAEHADAITAIVAQQFLFDWQWGALRSYANAKGVEIIGDLAIFVAHDSADVWARKDLFKLHPDGNPRVMAGVPPDYFSETGQLWGNPIYDWDANAAEGFAWWVARVGRVAELADSIRIDHFRGFAACWETPWGEPNAVNGRWVEAPGHALFTAMRAALPGVKVIAEDLGHITPDVTDLRDSFGFPGLKILQFEFGDGAPHGERHPWHYPKASVTYPGTHDNNTIQGWFRNEGADAAARAEDAPREAAAALELLGGDGTDIHWRFTELAMHSGSVLAIVALQDLLGLGAEGRFNVPGTIDGNWRWRATQAQMDSVDWPRLRALSERFGRL